MNILHFRGTCIVILKILGVDEELYLFILAKFTHPKPCCIKTLGIRHVYTLF